MARKLDFYYATIDDLVNIFEIIDLTGWGETIEDIERVLKNPQNTYVTVINEETGQMIGITLAVNNSLIGFIGHVIVLPEYRKKGIGEELMIEAIKLLKFKGCKTIKLDAVENAKTLYERVGFKSEVNSLRFIKENTDKQDLKKLAIKIDNNIELKCHVFNCKEHDLREVLELDKQIFGGDRSNFLLALFNDFPEHTFITRDSDDTLTGYLFGTYHDNTLKLRAGMSESFETSMNLLKASITIAEKEEDLKSIKCGLLENSSYGFKAMKFLGFSHRSTSYRMFWGDTSSATTHPKIFAIGDPAKG